MPIAVTQLGRPDELCGEIFDRRPDGGRQAPVLSLRAGELEQGRPNYVRISILQDGRHRDRGRGLLRMVRCLGRAEKNASVIGGGTALIRDLIRICRLARSG